MAIQGSVGAERKTFPKDCFSCRIWAGTVHIGVAIFVASHWRQQTHFASKAFLLAFSGGKYCAYLKCV